ncbi:unnamed protein product [Rotaria sp. Silwood1]|nr:unnamed protein product [Rotaria sp. Silwood1]
MLYFYIKRNYCQLNRIINYTLLSRYLSSTNNLINHNEIRIWSHSLRELLYHGKPEEVLKQYHNRQLSLCHLSVQIYCILFKAYTLTKNWSEGHQLYTQIRTNKKFFNDQRLQIATEKILSDLIASLSLSINPHHIDPTAFSILMTGYNLHHQPEKTLIIFDRVQYPDAISYLLVFQACSQLKDLQQGKRLVNKLAQSNIDLRKQFKLQTALFDMYGKCGDVSNAENIFETIENPTIVHYNSLLKVYNNKKMYEKAFQLYDKLKQNQKNLKPDQITFTCILYSTAKMMYLDRCQEILNDLNSSTIYLNNHPILQINLINALGKCGDIITAQKIFDQITQERTTGIYNALMKGYIYAQKPLTALSIFDKIPKLDAISYLIAINACAQIAMLRRARILYEQILCHFPSYKEDIRIMNALIDMFGKCADVTTAQHLFDSIENKHIISYNALINAYGLNGNGVKALEIYNSLLTPDEQTYAIILNACSHSLLVNEAEQIFDSIPMKCRNVFIYATMIDALCRASKMNQAQNLLAQYEQTNNKYPSMYITLLTAYARLQNINKVIEIRNLIEQYFPDNFHYISSATILLANTHAFLGNMTEARRLRTLAAEKNKLSGISKLPGISWTETNDGQIHEFIAHDKRHERTEDIYEELKHISDKLNKDGHIRDQRWITSDHHLNELNDPLNSHSERLALAYQLLLRRTISSNEPIQITKNLRICGDCHEIFKRITHIYQGLIILARDRTRHHKFQQGKCSCNDYF